MPNVGLTREINQTQIPVSIALGHDYVAYSVENLAAALLRASNEQFEAKYIDDVDESADFQQACDAFNAWRMFWRVDEEIDDVVASQNVKSQLCDLICAHREYKLDEFMLALEATEKRAHFPFGLNPLEFANLRAEKQPINVMRPEIDDPLSKKILAIAIHLREINGPNKSVLLPIEQLRIVLKCRKLVVGGAVKRLIKHNLLVEIGPKAHTGKAREFHVLAKNGVDYEIVK